MAKSPSLSGRKRIKELGSGKAIDEKKVMLEQMQRAHQQDVQQAEHITTVQSPKQSAKAGMDIDRVVAALLALAKEFSLAGTAIKHEYSPLAQQQILVRRITKVMQKHAEYLKAQRVDEQKNQQQCQQLVDAIRHNLARQGVHLNPLTVHKAAMS